MKYVTKNIWAPHREKACPQMIDLNFWGSHFSFAYILNGDSSELPLGKVLHWIVDSISEVKQKAKELIRRKAWRCTHAL